MRRPRPFILRVPLAWSATVALLCLPASASAREEPIHRTFSFPESFVLENPCNGEQVSVTGDNTEEFTGTSDHSQIVFRFSGSGEGNEGNSYRIQESEPISFGFKGDFAPLEQNVVSNLRFISEDTAPNFIAHTTIHLTINAQGETTAEVVNISTECRG